MTDFTQEVIDTIKSIPFGKVASYGQIAKICGYPKRSRQVSYVLHSMSSKHNLPWHRVVNSQGKISLTGDAYEKQKALLEDEGVEFSKSGIINMKRFSVVE